MATVDWSQFELVEPPPAKPAANNVDWSQFELVEPPPSDGLFDDLVPPSGGAGAMPASFEDKPLPKGVAIAKPWEPSLTDQVLGFFGGNREKAMNEVVARSIANDKKIPLDQVYENAGGHRPILNPEGRASVPSLIEGAGVVLDQSPDILPSAANTVLRSIRGGDDSVENTWLDQLIQSTTIQPKKNEKGELIEVDPNYASLQGIGKSLGYSLTNMGAGLGVGVPASMLASPAVGAVAGMGASGTVSFRASKDEFLDRVLEQLKAKAVETGKPLTQEEWTQTVDQYNAAANEYGAWEAIPEAVSNLIMLRGVGKGIKGFLGGMGSEQVTETMTALGQNHAERSANLTKEELGIPDAWRQHALQTAIMSGGMQSVGSVGSMVKDKLTSKKDVTAPAPDTTDSLSGIIASGEGDYNSYNKGIAGDSRDKIDFSQMTVGELMARQSLPKGNPNRIFAAGKYQATPTTFAESVQKLGISLDEKVTPELQERIFADYIAKDKRPDLRDYITGKSSDIRAAVKAGSMEFASVANPETGRSYHEGKGGNAASISAERFGTGLQNAREQYAALVAKGVDSNTAYRQSLGAMVNSASTSSSIAPNPISTNQGSVAPVQSANSTLTNPVPVRTPEPVIMQGDFNNPLLGDDLASALSDAEPVALSDDFDDSNLDSEFDSEVEAATNEWDSYQAEIEQSTPNDGLFDDLVPESLPASDDLTNTEQNANAQNAPESTISSEAIPQDTPNPDALESAPVQTAETTPQDTYQGERIIGQSSKIRSEDGQWHAVDYEVLDAARLNPTIEQADNQYRDRNRAALTQQVQSIGNDLQYELVGQSPVMDFGAPVLNQSGQIVAGNGRMSGIQEAYKTGKGAQYKAKLIEDAGRLGIDSARVQGMKYPVLVRRFKNAVNTRDMAVMSNEGGAARMSPLEQARVDAERVGSLHDLEFDDSGNITLPAARNLVRRILAKTPINQHNELMDAEGGISQAGLRRIQNAVLHLAYGDSPALQRLVERTDNTSRNVLNALNGAAPALAELRDNVKQGIAHPHLNIVPHLIDTVEIFTRLRSQNIDVQEWLNQLDAFNDTVEIFTRLRSQNIDVQEWLNQLDAFNDTPIEIKQLLNFLDQKARKPATLRDFLQRYAEGVKQAGNPKQAGLFGDNPPASSEVINNAIEQANTQETERNTSTSAESRRTGPNQDQGINPATTEQSSVAEGATASATSSVGGAQYSKAEALPQQDYNAVLPKIRNELINKLGASTFNKLVQSGRLVISDNAPPNVAGVYDNGVVTLYPQNIPVGQAWAVFVHEAGEHAALSTMLGNEYADLVKQFNQLLEKGNPDAIKAAERVPASTPAEHIDSERLAYLAQGVIAGGRLNPVGSRVIAAVRRFVQKVLKKLGIERAINPKDIAYLAERAAKSWASGKTASTLSSTKYTFAGERAKTADQAKDWFIGADDKARFEIDDSQFKLTPLFKLIAEGGHKSSTIKTVTYRPNEQNSYDVKLVPTDAKKTSDIIKIEGANIELLEELLPASLLESIKKHEGMPEPYSDDIDIEDGFYLKDVNQQFKGANVLPLDQAIIHPELFAAYPELKNILVMVDKDSTGSSASFNVLSSGEWLIRLGKYSQDSALIHEVQHAIQRLEGFATGGAANEFVDKYDDNKTEIAKLSDEIQDLMFSNSEYGDLRRKANRMFISIQDKYGTSRERNGKIQRGLNWDNVPSNEAKDYFGILDELKTYPEDKTYLDLFMRREHLQNNPTLVTAYQQYERLAGEVEARNVQARQKLNAQQRVNTPVEITEDVPRHLQTIRFNHGKQEFNVRDLSNPTKAKQLLKQGLASVERGIKKAWSHKNPSDLVLHTMTLQTIIDRNKKIFNKFAENPLTAIEHLNQGMQAVMQHWANRFEKSHDALMRLSAPERQGVMDMMLNATLNNVHPDQDYTPSLNMKWARGKKTQFENELRNLAADERKARHNQAYTPDERTRATKKAQTGLALLQKKMDFETKRFKAQPELVKQWQSLSTDQQAVYQDFKKQLNTLWEKQTESLEKHIADIVQENKLDANAAQAAMDTVKGLRLQYRKQLQLGPYFPLKRYGDYVVQVRSLGEYARYHFESEFEANEFADAIKKDEPKAKVLVSKKVELLNHPKDAPGIAGKLLSALNDVQGLTDDQKRTLNAFVLDQLPDLSARKAEMRRHFVAGASGDMERSFANAMLHGGHDLGRILFGHKIQRAMSHMAEQIKLQEDLVAGRYDDKPLVKDAAEQSILIDEADRVQAGRVLNVMRKQIDAMMSPNTNALAAFMSNAAFFMLLAGSPAAGLLNLMQIAQITYPALAARFGDVKANEELFKAAADVMKATKLGRTTDGKFDVRQGIFSTSSAQHLTSEERELLGTFELEGITSTTQANSLARTASGDGLANVGKFALKMSKAAAYLGFFFHNAEIFNRQVTQLAAYRLYQAVDKPTQQKLDRQGSNGIGAKDFARWITTRTHYNYGHANRALMIKGNAAKILLPMKNYSIMTTEFLLTRMKDVISQETDPEVKKLAAGELLRVMGTTALLAGAAGVGGAWMGTAALSTAVGYKFGGKAAGATALFLIAAMVLAPLMGDPDEPFDPEAMWTQFLREYLGDFGERAVNRGIVNATTDIDLSSRIGINSLLYREASIHNDQGGDWVNQLAEQLLGANYSLAKSMADGADLMSQGEIQKGMEKWLPKFLRDISKTQRYATDGLTGRKGEELLGADEFNAWELANQAMGFAPDDVTQVYDERSVIETAKVQLERRRNGLVNRYKRAVLDGKGDLKEIQSEINRWNGKNPYLSISPEDLKRTLKTTEKNRANKAEHSGVLISKKYQQQLEALGYK